MVCTRKFVNRGSRAVDENPLTVVSWNILADQYTDDQFASNCSPEHLAWENRLPRIIDELISYDADVICLQEVEKPSLPHFMARLPGYSVLFRGREDTNPSQWYSADTLAGCMAPLEGEALLTRDSRLTLLDHCLVRLADHVPDDLKAAGQGSETFDKLLERNEGGFIALMEDKATGRQMCIAGVHLYYDPWWPDVKLLQAIILTQQVRSFLGEQSKEQPTAMMIVGDFNSLWHKQHSDRYDKVPSGKHLTSGVYKLMSTGALCRTHVDHPHRRSCLRGFPHPGWKEFRAESALAPLLSCYYQSAEPPLTTKTARFAGCIDYIWLGFGWAVVSTLEMPYHYKPGQDASEMTDVIPMPNGEHPSDHLALGCQLITPCKMLSLF